MAGYYVPSSFASNYVSNKKNEDGTYIQDSAINQAGMDTQRSLQQLNKQYNVSINAAQAGGLLANRGLRSSALGSGYKQAYTERLQASVNDEIAQVSLSVAGTKQSIFNTLAGDLNQIGAMQLQEINNMRRMAGSLEQYHEYVKTLTDKGMNKYTDMNKFNMGATDTFEDNYANLFGINKGTVAGYTDENANPALAYEDWLRQNSGSGDKDTAWLDWAYGGGMTQYRDWTKQGVNSIYPKTPTPTAQTPTPTAQTPTPTAQTAKAPWWETHPRAARIYKNK